MWKRSDGKDFSFKVYEVNNRNSVPGNAGIDEGFVVGAVVFDFREPVAIPANTESEVLRFHFRVRPETTAQATELRFLDGGVGTGQPVPNRVTANGRAQYTKENAAFIFISGQVGILPDVITFVRGDSNGDGTVDLSDASATLGYLFLGEKLVSCFDAADSNDDGRLDIADPVAALNFLFLSGAVLPPPYPAAGVDPTADSMGCLHGLR